MTLGSELGPGLNRNSTKYFHTKSNNEGNKLMGREIEAKNINDFKGNLGVCQEKEDIEKEREKGGRQDFDQPSGEQVDRGYYFVRTFSV